VVVKCCGAAVQRIKDQGKRIKVKGERFVERKE
jgi:hypothetical protein